MAELERLLASTRLLTLTGAGGCGKTRLALEVARQMLDGFPDGVWLVDLTPLGEPSLVAQSVASVLDVRQSPGRSLVESLADQLRASPRAAAARQLRARDRQRRRARRNAAPRRGRADDSRHEPRSTRHRRRNGVAGAVADDARPAASDSVRRSPRVRGRAIAGRTGDGCWLHVRGHERQRRHGRGGVPAARRDSAGDRAGGRAVEGLVDRADQRQARRSLPAADPSGPARESGGSERSKPPSTGATTCSRTTSAGCCGGFRRSPAGGRSRLPSTSAPATGSIAHDVLDLMTRLVDKSLVIVDADP